MMKCGLDKLWYNFRYAKLPSAEHSGLWAWLNSAGLGPVRGMLGRISKLILDRAIVFSDIHNLD